MIRPNYIELGFDSDEEMLFAAWCDEAEITYKYKPKTFILSEPVKLMQQNPRSISEVHLFHGTSYTPDYLLLANAVSTIIDLVDIYVHPIQKSLKSCPIKSCGDSVWIDVKGSNFMGSSRSSDVRFPIIQKWLYKEHNVYVNSLVPDKLFDRTWYPEVYFWTGKGKEKCKKVDGELIPLSNLLKKKQ